MLRNWLQTTEVKRTFAKAERAGPRTMKGACVLSDVGADQGEGRFPDLWDADLLRARHLAGSWAYEMDRRPVSCLEEPTALSCTTAASAGLSLPLGNYSTNTSEASPVGPREAKGAF